MGEKNCNEDMDKQRKQLLGKNLQGYVRDKVLCSSHADRETSDSLVNLVKAS
jgi:hypothetical protein